MVRLGRNVFTDRSIYNEPLKEEFLSNHSSEATMRIYRRIFIHSKPYEEKLDKDLATFTDEEIDYFIRNYIKPTTFISAKSNCRFISNYLKFAIEKNMRETNPLQVNEKELRKYQTVEDTDLITAMDIDDITMTELANANDALIIRLVFEGAMGFELSEITNLTVNDINEDTNTITLYDDDKKKREKGTFKRELVVSRGTMELIRSARIERIYRKKNGEMDESNPRIKTEVELVDSPHIIRPTKTTQNAINEKCSRATLYYRLRVIRESEALKMVSDVWNTKQIQRSGMLWQALKVLKQKGKIEKTDYQEIAERFGIFESWHIRDIINVDVIKKVYGENYMEIDTDDF